MYKRHEIFQLLSLLLQYPHRDWLDMAQLRQQANSITDSLIKRNLTAFLDYLDQRSIYKLAEEYVEAFDFSEDTTLYLTAHLCDNERERGQLLAELKDIYSEAGLDVATGELPDYLPMVMEFLAIADWQASDKTLALALPAMKKLWRGLDEAGSSYALLLETCLLTAAAPHHMQPVQAAGGI